MLRQSRFYQWCKGPAIRNFGSVGFLIGNVAVFAIWIAMNVRVIPNLKPFDPYPFEFLTMSVSLEAIVLSIVVLIAQKELQTDADEHAELDLQINLLAEREATMILKKLDRIEKHFGIDTDEEERKRVVDLIKETHPEKLAELIHKTAGAGTASPDKSSEKSSRAHPAKTSRKWSYT